MLEPIPFAGWVDVSASTVACDMSELNAEQRAYSWKQGLGVLLDKVSMAMPLLDFKIDPTCIGRKYLRDGDSNLYIYRVKVFADGEALGALSVSDRYSRGLCELTYGISSFRVNKERGPADTTYTKDLKVAIRTAKKVLEPRANEELVQHIRNNVAQQMNELIASTNNRVRWLMSVGEEALIYAQAAYVAHKAGKDKVELPVRMPTVGDFDNFLKVCEVKHNVDVLWNLWSVNEGYSINMQADGKIVCLDTSNNKITKYREFEEMPTDLANKMAMFKVIDTLEPYAHIGVKLKDNFFFVPNPKKLEEKK